jgi:hypothetical protein
MNRLFECCAGKPFTMVLEGFVDPEMPECDFIDMCCSIGDSLDFCICYEKTITETRQFRTPCAEGYKTRFSFHVLFPTNRGTKRANKAFIKEKMARLLEVCLEKDLPVGLEGAFDHSGKKTFALLKP